VSQALRTRPSKTSNERSIKGYSVYGRSGWLSGQIPPKYFRRRSLFRTFLTRNDVEARVMRGETEHLIWRNGHIFYTWSWKLSGREFQTVGPATAKAQRRTCWDGDAVRPEDVDWLNDGAAMTPHRTPYTVMNQLLWSSTVLAAEYDDSEVIFDWRFDAFLNVTHSVNDAFCQTCHVFWLQRLTVSDLSIFMSYHYIRELWSFM